MDELSGKVAVVTGASSGIGAAAAKMLAEAGATVVVGYNSSLDRARQVIDGMPGKNIVRNGSCWRILRACGTPPTTCGPPTVAVISW